jgi:steroid 5-alpha reductase family enzyme
LSAYPTADLGTALSWAGGAVLVVLIATFGAAKITGKHSVIDTAWGLLFAVIAVVAFVGSSGPGDPLRRALLLGLPVLWGLRLAIHIGRRTVGQPEDPRYRALLAKAKGRPDWYALRMVYLLQGGLALLVSAPILVGAFEPGPVWGPAWVGLALWAVGLFLEAVGDQQLAAFRRDPANRGKVMDVGLWRYTRHPNYFGDACAWWGIFLVAAEHWPGGLTIPAPIIMTLLLTKGSGARILDQHMAQRDGWAAYAARTSSFIPRPRMKS